ncbi:uncharacterized protein LOC123558906 [Mercenaria mercenaria]|uniref:uncharacterized protein LOC123558906 n=1 Tax=Mercenaria mercenaria TaxID=6596 RepID=UPI00234EAA71|nr:uncharacterized protein LOC123558906 [Mercenaria mercenaria]
METFTSGTSVFVHLLFGFLLLQKVTPDTTTTTTVAPGVFDNCASSGAFINATISPNFDYIYSPGYESGSYPNNKVCRWYVTAPDNYAVEAYFDNETFAIERNTYCSYDYVIFYDGNSTSDTMINKFCGFDRPETAYRSSSTAMLIVFSSDYILQYAGFRIRIKAVDNTYPGCTADYTTYPVMYNREEVYIFNNYTFINNISTPGFGSSDYPTNLEMFWLFTSTNTTHYRMVLDIISISIERSHGCIYDKLVLYNGPCTKDDVLDTVCGYWAKQWDLSGPEYLLHFHSDFYLSQSGFLLNYYAEEIAVTTPLITSTTTFGPPVEAVIDAVKEMLANYSTEDLPARDLSEPIEAYVDFFFVGINGLDEVEQKLTTTGQFEVTWMDPSLSWDPTKRQGVVKVLLPQNDIWKPDIALMNGFSTITAMGAKFMFIDINYNGSCIWKPYQVMESVCKVDMTHYPYDRQICILKFGTWSTDDSEVVTELGSLGLQLHPNFQENAEWRLISTETRQEDSNRHKVVEFYLTLERNSRYVTYYMTVPIIMLAYMNVLTFVVPCVSGEKTGYSITLFLSFVVLLIINNESLQENSDTISLYAAYVLTMTILSALALIISVLQIRAITFEERRYPLPKCLKNMIHFVNRTKSYLPCRQTEKDSKQKRKKKEEKTLEPKTTVKENDTLKPEATDSGNSGYGSSISYKKRTVAFKIDNEDNLDNTDREEESDRFSVPRKREFGKITLERETTLFEENALIRRSTSFEMYTNTNGKQEKPDLFDTTPTAAEIMKETATNSNKEPGTFEDISQNCDEERADNDIISRNDLKDGTSETESQIIDNSSKCNTSESEDVNDKAKETEVITKGQHMSSEPGTLVVIDQNTIVNQKLSLVKDNLKHISGDDNVPSIREDNPIPNVQVPHDTDTSKLGRQPKVIADEYVAKPLQIISDNQYEQHPAQSATQELFNPLDEYISSHNIYKEVQTDQISNDCALTNSHTHSKVRDAVKPDSDHSPTADELQTLDSKDLKQVKSIGQQSGSLIAEITELQPVVVNDVKMNRPTSATENRPLSVNRQFSAGDHGFALASHGRALSGATTRPVSTREGWAISVLSPRPISIVSRKRSASAMSQNENTFMLFGSEETDRKTPTTEIDNHSHASDDHSSESVESSSITESCDESDDDDISWADLVSCTDFMFFIIYLFVTTLFSLAMFMTMVQAY